MVVENKLDLFRRLEQLKINASGRAMWTGGTDWSERPEGVLGLINCFGMVCDDTEVFPLAMDLLMCGGGVGMSFEQKHIQKLPRIYRKKGIKSVKSIGSYYEEGQRHESTYTTYVRNSIGITVGDSREGWVQALRLGLKAMSDPNVDEILFDFGFVRPAGVPIKGFGGVSSPEKLEENFIKILTLINEQQEFTSVVCEKILGSIAEIVVAGGVRRSARLSLYSNNDEQFAALKQNLYTQNDQGQFAIDPDRAMTTNANHTATYYSVPSLDQIRDAVTSQYNTGEGAIANMAEAAARVNSDVIPLAYRSDFIKKYRSSREEALEYLRVSGVADPDERELRLSNVANPCFEIIGVSGFACNLSQVQLNKHVGQPIDEINRSFYLAGQLAAQVLMRDFPHPILQRAKELDPIVGVSCTGLIDYFVQTLGRQYIQWWMLKRPRSGGGRIIYSSQNMKQGEFETQYEYFSRYERFCFTQWRKSARAGTYDFCDKNGLKRPSRCTTIQPAGTVSLLTDSSCGIHWPKDTRYIRRLTIAKNAPMALACRDAGYKIIPSAKDKDADGQLLLDPMDDRCTEWMIEVPFEISWADMAERFDLNKIPAISQLDFSLVAMNCYADHTVSQTLELEAYEIEELSIGIQSAIEQNKGYVSTALLARFDAKTSAFPRLPYEPISKEVYLERVGEIDHLRDLVEDAEYYRRLGFSAKEAEGTGCDGMKCLIK